MAKRMARRLALSQAAFAAIRRLSTAGGGAPPHLCHRLAYFSEKRASRRWIPTASTEGTWRDSGECAPPPTVTRRPQGYPPPSPQCRSSDRRIRPGPSLRDCRPSTSRWTGEPPPLPPLRKHLPIDALARLTIPYGEGLSRFPLVLKMAPPPGTDIPPPALMTRTYATLRHRARHKLLERWAEHFPTLHYYPYPPSLTPHPIMGLDKFIAGRVHQMRAGKSYLASHPSWYHENPDTTCPQCDSSPETLEHAILHCPEKARERARLLEDVSSLGPDSPTW